MTHFPLYEEKASISLKDRLVIVNQIIKLSLKKGLSFSVNATTKGIDVFKLENSNYLFNENAYFSDSLFDYESEYNNSLTTLLEKVKNYK